MLEAAGRNHTPQFIAAPIETPQAGAERIRQ